MRRLSLAAVLLTLGACSSQMGTTTDPVGPPGYPPPNNQPPNNQPPVTDSVLVWANSPTALFSFDPRTNQVRTVGNFSVEGAPPTPLEITDLAVNAQGEVWAISFQSLYRVNTQTATLTWVAHFADFGFNALTFVPAGVLDPARETLVAVSVLDYYRVDTQTGAATRIGSYGGGFSSSGDLVSIANAGTFATANSPDPWATSDVLVRIDLATGQVTPIGAGIGFDFLYGLGYWRSRLFGFSDSGQLVEINIQTGVGTVVTPNTGTTQFWGAGVTTVAPVGPI